MNDANDVRQAWAELAEWGNHPELNALDSLMWRTERPPSDSCTGVVVMLLDSAPSWERLWKAHEWAVRIVPRLGEKVVEPIIPTGAPRWSKDPDFDLAHHLRRVVAPSPGTLQEVLEIAQRLGVSPLDRVRPPWIGVLVEGLEDGRAAYILQVHHVLFDGAGATQLFIRLLSRTRESQSDKPWPDHAGRRTFTPTSVAVEGVKDQIAGVPGLLRGLTEAAISATTHPARAVEYVRSLIRVASPPPPTGSPLLACSTRVNWVFEPFECPIANLKRAAKTVGGTVNDAFVCAILGGLRNYHVAQGVAMDDVPISRPVSVRDRNDSMGGNRFTAAFFSAPSSVSDPAERIHEMRERVSQVRSEPALDFISTLTPAMNLAPGGVATAALGALATGAAMTTSSWLGLSDERYLAGARFDRMFVFGPLPGTTMCAALCTHVDTACIGLNIDGGVYTDRRLFRECVTLAFEEVLALGAPSS